MSKMSKLSIMLLALLTSVPMLGYINRVNAEGTCIVKIEAPAQVDPDVDFNVSIIAENIPDQNGGMAGWQLILVWNATKLNCTGEILNLEYWPQNSGPLVANPIDNENGKYRQALALRSPSTPVTGTYWLVNLTFHSTSDVPEPIPVVLEIRPDIEYGMTYCLVDKLGNEIPHEFGQTPITIISEYPNMLFAIMLIMVAMPTLALFKKTRKHS